MHPLKHILKKRKIQAIVAGVFVLLVTPISSLNSEPIGEEAFSSAHSIWDSVPSVEVSESLTLAAIPTEPKTYALIAGGMLLGFIIFRRKLGVNETAKTL